MNEEILLEVFYSNSAEKGIRKSRIPPQLMQKLNINSKDVIQITGGKTTISKCFPLNQSDNQNECIRMDTIIMFNAGTSVDKSVKINKIDEIPYVKYDLTNNEMAIIGKNSVRKQN